jgi:secondary thiamine-phosphate synthase enzyme
MTHSKGNTVIRSHFIETTRPIEALNVTEHLAALIGGVEEGLAFFYIPHTTASLLLCEDDDELRADLERTAELWLAGCRPFAHIRNNNPNSEAHILSAFGGAGVTLAVEGGKLDLGAYQNVLLLEMDGPKRRELRCKVIQG